MKPEPANVIPPGPRPTEQDFLKLARGLTNLYIVNSDRPAPERDRRAAEHLKENLEQFFPVAAPSAQPPQLLKLVKEAWIVGAPNYETGEYCIPLAAADPITKLISVPESICGKTHPHTVDCNCPSPMSDGWTVIESTKQSSYNFAVVGKNGETAAYAVSRQTADNYAAQMNEKGFIEP
jgi:hypothetical protein